jgi:hypothetical protein
MTATEARAIAEQRRNAYQLGYDDARAANSPCPPNGPGYLAYLDGYNDAKGDLR